MERNIFRGPVQRLDKVIGYYQMAIFNAQSDHLHELVNIYIPRYQDTIRCIAELAILSFNKQSFVRPEHLESQLANEVVLDVQTIQ